MLPHSLHPRAATEFDAVFAWYDARSPEVAARFAEDVERALRDLCERPLTFPFWPKIEPKLGVHRYLMKDFPYAIPFIIERASIHIIAFAHLRRRPGYWVRRVHSRRHRG